VISFQNVSKRYNNGHQALNQVSFELDESEMVFLTGHSGAGKSTLLKLLAMIERCHQGKIYLKGKDLTRVNNRQIPFYRRHIGIIFQDPHLLSDRNVFDNVALPLVIAGLRHQEVARRVRASLDKVGLLNKERSYPQALSSGEKQRVGIARAVVNKPALILADEPTGNLDPELSEEIMQLFEQFNSLGATVLVASHDLALVGRMKHRILTLHQGRLVSAGVAAHE
jgi:cell division transport system ATP-binding protein